MFPSSATRTRPMTSRASCSRGIREQQRELVAADPECESVAGHELREQRAEAREDAVADRMAVTVVDLLEVVEVEEDERERMVGETLASVQSMQEGAPVQQAREGS